MSWSAHQQHQTGQNPIITVKQEHRTGDSFITLNEQHQTGRNPIITVKQEHQTGDSIITVKQEHQTGVSFITVKKEHRTGDLFITVKKEHPTDDSFITVKVINSFNRGYDFRVKRNEPLHELLMRWRNREEIEDCHKFYFIVNGRAIYDDNKTANDIGLKDGDCVRVMILQTSD